MPLWVHPMWAEIRPKGAREVAQKAAREADRAGGTRLVSPHGGLRRAGPAVTDDRRA
jgi:hypothetical protein